MRAGGEVGLLGALRRVDLRPIYQAATEDADLQFLLRVVHIAHGMNSVWRVVACGRGVEGGKTVTRTSVARLRIGSPDCFLPARFL